MRLKIRFNHCRQDTMRTLLISTLLFAMGACLPAITTSYSIPPEDLDGSGHDLESSGSGSGEWAEVSKGSVRFTTISTFTMTMSEDYFMFNAIDEEDKTVPIIMTDNTRNKIPEDSDLTFDKRPKLGDDNNGSAIGNVAKSGSILANEALAAIIAGGVVGLALAASLLTLMVYSMKKKDEGGYTVNQKNTSNGGYQKPKTKEEFIA
ncbi:syndecan-1 [Coregonus clupeaformis]|uniref:syndecan-1 n=1 Tax=Coregonus clupeaformis TaxID=59861 RepID=UPI001BE10E11|nr:syndecan-1 [Coregonus clupeaformis]